MPRGPPTGLSLLLMAGLAFATATSPPNNPWLSDLATDLQTASSAVDLRPRCESPEPLCPPPCPPNITKPSTSIHQCLYYLQESHKDEVCGRDDLTPQRRRNLLHGLRMRHCCEHAVDSALPPAAFQGGNVCRKHLSALIDLDRLVHHVHCGIHDLLTHYDCEQSYSIVHTCKNCENAYRRWVCSSLVPHYSSKGERVRPCLAVCHDVEQQCPYLLPQDYTNITQQTSSGETVTQGPTPQYAGEPTFFCLDPNIPEQELNSSSGDEDCCYTHCGSSGRGTTTGRDEAPAPHGVADATANASGRTAAQILGLCEHCPGRPTGPGPPPRGDGNGTAPSAVASLSSGAAHQGLPRTINKVFLLWTAWFCCHNAKTVFINAFKCLLVLCAYCVRTTVAILWTKTYWNRSCS
ncbi:uncharacterized protein LOC109596131 [Aethina tumida]|uniref:uncharacterized protein LOC109596131 n=1 Tax=Aethina tumida TaxID=116153 RepID=UPI002148D3CC|nr:uncharacterized protein LOC109596131 [Aethina tumida]XP_049821867.1 uncharacterized protein LOC109596131 [Aethina tumida]